MHTGPTEMPWYVFPGEVVGQFLPSPSCAKLGTSANWMFPLFNCPTILNTKYHCTRRELLSLADALAGLAAYVDAEGLAGQPPPGRQADVDRLDALHYQLDLTVSTSTALLQLVVPALSDAAQQSHIVTAAAEVAHASGAALLAIHSAHERSAAWQASDHAMFAELMDEWAEHQCQLVCQLLAAGDGGKGVQPAAADAAAQAWSPANLAAWLRAVTPVLDAIAASLGKHRCTSICLHVILPCPANPANQVFCLVACAPCAKCARVYG